MAIARAEKSLFADAAGNRWLEATMNPHYDDDDSMTTATTPPSGQQNLLLHEQQSISVFQLDREHRQRRESIDRRCAEATETIMADAFESGDEDLITFNPRIAVDGRRLQQQQLLPEQPDRRTDESRTQSRFFSLRPRMRRFPTSRQLSSSQTSNDYFVGIDFSVASSGRRDQPFQYNTMLPTNGELLRTRTTDNRLAPLHLADGLHLLPNIRLNDDDDEDDDAGDVLVAPENQR